MQITNDDPVGSYAVSSIIYEQAKSIGYHQVSLSIQYKRTAQEIKNIVNIKNQEDFDVQLTDTFRHFKTRQVFNVSFSGDENTLLDMVYKAYYNLVHTEEEINRTMLGSYMFQKLNNLLS